MRLVQKHIRIKSQEIYHGCSTRKTFWEEKFAGKNQVLFEPVNMRNCGKRNVRSRAYESGNAVIWSALPRLFPALEYYGIITRIGLSSSHDHQMVGLCGCCRWRSAVRCWVIWKKWQHNFISRNLWYTDKEVERYNLQWQQMQIPPFGGHGGYIFPLPCL